MVRKLITASTAVILAIGVVGIVGSGVAAAHGKPDGHGKPPAPVAATGTTTCNFHGTLAVTKTGTVAIRGNITRHHALACSSNGGTKLRTGHLSGLTSTGTITGLCSMLSGGSLPDASGGTIHWSPKHKVASSTGVALTGGSLSVVTIGTQSFLQVTYTDGSVAGGSFTNASGASLTATSRQTTTQLTARCADGPVKGIAVRGSLTL